MLTMTQGRPGGTGRSSSRCSPTGSTSRSGSGWIRRTWRP